MNQPRQGQQGGRGRPGAMTMAMQAVQVRPSGPKVLRIGLIQSGKIVEERIIRKRESVTVGSSEKNHFIVPAKALPPRFELFQLVGQSYVLNFTDAMQGRVGLPAGVQELEELRKKGGARNAGTHWQVKLNDNSRGKVTIGDVTFLFQFVVPPPIQPRPQLPAATRGGFIKGIDWLFTAFLVSLYMAVFGFIIYLENADWPIENTVTEIPESIVRFVISEPEPPKPEEEATDEEEATEESAEEAPAPKPTQPRPNVEPSGEAKAAAEATARIVAEQARAQAEAMILSALGEGGALENVLKGGAITTNTEEVLAQASGVAVAQGSGANRLRERAGGGTGQTGSLSQLGVAGGKGATQAAGEGGAVQERAIRGNVRFSGGDEITGTGTFDQSQVSQLIRARKSAFKRCYETALRSNPTLQGKLVVEFTIVERGNVTGARAVENTTGDSALEACVVGVVQRLRWRQGPEGGSVGYAYPFVFAPQN